MLKEKQKIAYEVEVTEEEREILTRARDILYKIREELNEKCEYWALECEKDNLSDFEFDEIVDFLDAFNSQNLFEVKETRF